MMIDLCPSLGKSHNEISGDIYPYGCWNGEELEGSWWLDQFPFVALAYITFRNETVDIIFHTWPKERMTSMCISLLEAIMTYNS